MTACADSRAAGDELATTAVGVFLVAATLLTLLGPNVVNHDSAWYLAAAGEVLAGKALYIDVIDVNPPLIVYLSMLPVIAARWLGVSEIRVFIAFVLAVAAASVWLVDRVARRFPPLNRPRDRAALGMVMVYFGALEGVHLGQREHLLFLCATPYLLLAGVRHGGLPMPRRLAVAIGAFAALGFALKPHFLLAPLLVQGYVVIRHRRARLLLAPENIALACVLALYAGHFLLLPAPVIDGLRCTVELAQATYHGYQVDLLTLVQSRPLQVGLLAGMPLLLLAWTARLRCLGAGLGLGWLGFIVAAVWQQKNWTYHFLAARNLGCLSAVIIGLALVDRLGSRRPRWAIAALLIAVAASAWFGAERLARDRHANSDLAARHSQLAARLRPLIKNGTFAALDTGIEPYFPLLNTADLHWSLRFNCLWPLPGIYAERPASGSYYTPAQRGWAEQFLVEALVEDLRRSTPDVIAVAQPPLYRMVDARFDALQWLLQEPRFAEFWQQYAFAFALPDRVVYARK